MQCTECGKQVLPVVAWDIDGTLSQYHQPFVNMICDYLGRPRFVCDWNGTGDFEDWLDIPREQYEAIKLAYRQGGFKRWSPPHEENLTILKAALQLCSTRGLPFELWMTTTRPYNRLDSTDPDTRWWLERQNIPYDHLLYDEHKYVKLAEIVGADRVVAVVEDLPEYVEEAYEAFGPQTAICMPVRSHNRAYRNKSSFAQARQWMPNTSFSATTIFRAVNEWYGEHGNG